MEAEIKAEQEREEQNRLYYEALRKEQEDCDREYWVAINTTKPKYEKGTFVFNKQTLECGVTTDADYSVKHKQWYYAIDTTDKKEHLESDLSDDEIGYFGLMSEMCGIDPYNP